jgi:GR25 family glycosyltransferase involved in LPS biosynthesis
MKVKKGLIKSCHYINLDFSEDRRLHIVKEIRKKGMIPRRFPAIFSDDIKERPDHFRPVLDLPEDEGALREKDLRNIACKMSHCALWKMLKISSKYQDFEFFLVVEDDAVLRPNFTRELRKILKQVPDNWDFVYLSHNKLMGDRVNKAILRPTCTTRRGYNASLYCYIIRRKGIRKLRRLLIPATTEPIDCIMRKNFHKFKAYFSYKTMAKHHGAEFKSIRQNKVDF